TPRTSKSATALHPRINAMVLGVGGVSETLRSSCTNELKVHRIAAYPTRWLPPDLPSVSDFGGEHFFGAMHRRSGRAQPSILRSRPRTRLRAAHLGAARLEATAASC